MKKFHHLTFADRLKLEALLKAKVSKKEIAKILEVHISTIYREVKKGRFERLDGQTWKTEERYSPDISEEKYRNNLMKKGREIKIKNDPILAKYIEDIIIEKEYSPEAALSEIKKQKVCFQTSICVTTLYHYIEKGVFERLSLKVLPVKRNKKPKKRKVKKQAQAAKGTSIEKRPEEVNSREVFGHWEMDTVIGARGKSKKSLLVLTERKTRKEIVELMPDNTTKSVVQVLDRIERRCGAEFQRIFQTITVDNGTEFSDFIGMEQSKRGKKKRTRVFYCHPYSSFERGSNEVNNRFIRRKLPKGYNFELKTPKEIKQIETWMNEYPRRQFGFQSAEERFQKEIEILRSG